MDDKRPILIATEETNKLPLLIIDKQGNMGVEFSERLAEQFLTVLVSGHLPKFSQNTIHISYRKKIPKIPDNRYSHMFVFYNGEEEVLDMLPALMNKANSIKAKLIFITSLLHSSHKLLTHLTDHAYHSMQLVIYGELFQAKGAHDNMVNIFLNQAHRYGRIILPHDLGKLYPVFVDDVFEAIIKEAFVYSAKKKPLLVFPRHAISELSIARMIKKNNPHLKIDFRKYQARSGAYYIPPNGEYFMGEYPLEERLSALSKSYKPTQFEAEHKIVLPRKKTQFKPSIIFLALLSGFLLPIIISLFIGVMGMGALFLSVNQIEKGEFEKALSYAKAAKAALTIATVIGDQFNTGLALSETEVDLLNSVVALQAVATGNSQNPKNDFLYSLAVFKNSLITLQKMKAEGVLPRTAEKKLIGLETVLTPIENTLDSLPYLLGLEGKRVYLVLFQNNMELRPGGGFIGSYGILSLDKGRITDFKVHDVYDADGKLTMHIEPPFAIRRFLGAPHWFLRDSNFAIDFPTNAEKAKMFLKFETGESVDGVIAVDTSFIKNILGAIGPVAVSDYNETVNKDNFYLLTQSHAEKDFFPGSTQKKDFLRSLLNSMQQKIADNNFSYVALAKAVGESIKNKHLFFAFADPPSQKLFAINNLSASLSDLREKEENEFLDFFAVIDANFGLNKSNYYLKRSIDHKAIIGINGDLEGTATITYENTSKKDSPFAGDYKNYLRFVLPVNTTLKDIKIDNVSAKTTAAITDPEIFTAKNFIAPKDLELERGHEQGKATFGFLLTVPAGKSKKVSISYSLTKAIDTGASAFSYNLRVFKQPGTENDPYSFSLDFPNMFRPINLSPELSDVGGKLLYSGVLSQDMELKAKFGRR